MTIRQTILKAAYPLLMWAGKWSKKTGAILTNNSGNPPPTDLYNLQAIRNNGEPVSLSDYKGKKILVVNTASDCGYTAQLDALQDLFERYQAQLEILAFPSNDFQQQEKGTDAAIAEFCSLNYHIQFPIMQKTVVIKGPQQHPVMEWLSNSKWNGWNNVAPGWNFTKYLIDEQGRLTHVFGTAIAPDDKVVLEALGGPVAKS